MATYGDCVSALRGSLSHLEGSVSTLGTGVADFPRLVNVLKTVRVSISPASNTTSSQRETSNFEEGDSNG